MVLTNLRDGVIQSSERYYDVNGDMEESIETR